MKQYKITAYYIVVLLVLIISACSKMDDYKAKFTAGGSIVYTGRMDSVKVSSGRNRVKITGLFTSDPNIVKYRVFWNSRQDSIEMPVKRTTGVDSAKVTISNLPEGLMSFEIRTYDAQGHSSVAVDTAANVYGDIYQAGITNRAIVDASMQNDGSALISWVDVNKDAGVQSMEIKYSDKFNKAHDTLITSALTGPTRGTFFTTSLPNFKAGNTISYSTTYLPNAMAIDKFSTAYQTHTVKADVTSIYLSNTGPSFQGVNFDGRFGKLGAPWVSNAGALNKSNGGGSYGGWAIDPIWDWWGTAGGINWETYGNTPVINGIIYQPTSLPLPAGNYMISFDEYSEIQTNSSVYCVVAAGGSGIPTLANLSTALGYRALYNGATINDNKPNLSDTRTFTFTLTTPQVVSIGFLGNMAAVPSGNYFVISKIQLFIN